MRSPPFTALESVYLDLIRFGLALSVLITHISEPFFCSSFDEKIQNLGVIAVGCFFILSGYTISAINQQSRSNFSARKFLIERTSRLLSVSLPAFALTAVLDAGSYLLAPDFYLQNWAGNIKHAIIQVAASALFLSQSHGYSPGGHPNCPTYGHPNCSTWPG